MLKIQLNAANAVTSSMAPVVSRKQREVAVRPTGIFVPQQSSSRLEFRIHSVKCLDETGAQNMFGSDEIWLGATAVDTAGKTHKLDMFKLHGDFDKGEIKRFDPPKSLFQFDLRNGAEFPKSYFVTLLMVEKDSNNATNILNKLFDATRAQVGAHIAVAKTGSGIVGDVLGKSIEKIASGVFGTIGKFLGDDALPPHNETIVISSAAHRFKNGKQEQPDVALLKGQGGKYQVNFDWRIS
jgi:hypothetical protein